MSSTSDRKFVFNTLVSYYNQLYAHKNGKDNQRYVAEEWKFTDLYNNWIARLLRKSEANISVGGHLVSTQLLK